MPQIIEVSFVLDGTPQILAQTYVLASVPVDFTYLHSLCSIKLVIESMTEIVITRFNYVEIAFTLSNVDGNYWIVICCGVFWVLVS